MTLSDTTEINESLKFLGKTRLIYDRAGEVVVGAHFTFNSHKIYFDTEEEANTIRTEILQKIPLAKVKDASNESAEKWPDPPVVE